METEFRFADELGPAKVIHIHEPRSELKAVLVVDNVAAGPSIGGLRMAPDVSSDECFRLARAMTLKNAMAGLAHGGGKSVLFGDPHMPLDKKERLIRAFARAVGDVEDYITGPDMGTDERCMAWVQDEIGRSVGLPPEIGGIPLDEIGATGFGLAAAVEIAAARIGLELKGARMVVQGFGSVGKHAARFLSEAGAVLVGAADSKGTLASPDGLDVARLIALKEEGGKVTDFPAGQKLDRDAVVGIACDIWIPAARPDVLRAVNIAQLDAKLVAQGANIPATDEAEAALHQRGVLSIPDFVANAGGVICAAVEYHGGTQTQALQTIEEKIRHNTAEVLERAAKANRAPREVAVELATERVRRAMTYRRA